MPLLGRRKIFTTEKEITRDNLIDVLRKAYDVHRQNKGQIQFLMNYERGIQPLQREKTVRPEIDLRITDDIANYIKNFHIGYFWSNPIMLVQRGNKELHNTSGEVDNIGITELNEMLKNGESIGYKDQCMGEFVEIGGIGHKLVDPKTDFSDPMFINAKGEYVGSLVNVYTLDSRYAFCVYYNGPGQKKLLGVSYSDTDGENFTCFTDNERFEVLNWKIESESVNVLGKVPIIEYERSFDRTGVFERCLSEMDGLNILLSDFTNDLAQRTQEIWWGDNIDFPKDEKTGEELTPKSGQWILTTSEDGRVAKIQPMSSSVDNTGTLTAISDQRNWILQKCNVPIQYDSAGGGSTGVAMDISSGWSNAEVAAMQKQQMIENGKREELNLILKAISLVPSSVLPEDSDIRKVHSMDVEFHFSRKKNYDLTTKSNFIATMLAKGFAGDHVLVAADVFPDNAQVWEDSKDMVIAIQKSIIKDNNASNTSSERIGQDLSDQVTNSPFIDGMSVNS